MVKILKIDLGSGTVVLEVGGREDGIYFYAKFVLVKAP